MRSASNFCSSKSSLFPLFSFFYSLTYNKGKQRWYTNTQGLNCFLFLSPTSNGKRLFFLQELERGATKPFLLCTLRGGKIQDAFTEPLTLGQAFCLVTGCLLFLRHRYFRGAKRTKVGKRTLFLVLLLVLVNKTSVASVSQSWGSLLLFWYTGGWMGQLTPR